MNQNLIFRKMQGGRLKKSLVQQSRRQGLKILSSKAGKSLVPQVLDMIQRKIILALEVQISLTQKLQMTTMRMSHSKKKKSSWVPGQNLGVPMWYIYYVLVMILNCFYLFLKRLFQLLFKLFLLTENCHLELSHVIAR